MNDSGSTRQHSPEPDSSGKSECVERLQQQLEQQAVELARLRVLVMTDPLTGIANRRRFDEELTRCIAEFDRLQRDFCIVFIDLDDFKRINDQGGHTSGDRVLTTFARCLRNQIRATDIVARIGGDEFAMIFPATDIELARTIIERAREQITTPLQNAAGGLAVGWSAGFVEMKPGMTGKALMDAADQSMYATKHNPSVHSTSAKEKPGTRPGLSK